MEVMTGCNLSKFSIEKSKFLNKFEYQDETFEKELKRLLQVSKIWLLLNLRGIVT